MELKQIKEQAEALSVIRKEIEDIEIEMKTKVEKLKFKKEQLQNSLLAGLQENDLSSIKTSEGTSYCRSSRKSLDITDNEKAISWATKFGAISVNKTEAKKILKDEEKLPEGFEYSEKEFISIRNKK